MRMGLFLALDPSISQTSVDKDRSWYHTSCLFVRMTGGGIAKPSILIHGECPWYSRSPTSGCPIYRIFNGITNDVKGQSHHIRSRRGWNLPGPEDPQYSGRLRRHPGCGRR